MPITAFLVSEQCKIEKLIEENSYSTYKKYPPRVSRGMFLYIVNDSEPLAALRSILCGGDANGQRSTQTVPRR